jgi:predicted transcriptional regulator
MAEKNLVAENDGEWSLTEKGQEIEKEMKKRG